MGLLTESCALGTFRNMQRRKLTKQFLFLCRDFSPALFNSAPILPSGSSMSNQLTSQLSSDSSPGQASSLGLRPIHDPMLTSPPPNSATKGLEDGYELFSLFLVFFYVLVQFLTGKLALLNTYLQQNK